VRKQKEEEIQKREKKAKNKAGKASLKENKEQHLYLGGEI